jgi:hypothetical protein
MNSNSEASSSIVATGGNDARTWNSRWIGSLRYLLLLFAVVSPYAAAFLHYPSPDASDTLYDLSWICWPFVFVVSLGVLLLRRWIAVAIFAVAWIWLFLGPSHGPGESFYWVMKQGFRFHASPVRDYLTKCKLVEFTENGVGQTFGFCEGADRGTFIESVFYDTTGEYALPLSQRTAEWRHALLELVSEEHLEARAEHFFDNFYVVCIPLENFHGG